MKIEQIFWNNRRLPLFELPGAHDEPRYAAGQRSWHSELRIRIFRLNPDPGLRSYPDPVVRVYSDIQAAFGSGLRSFPDLGLRSYPDPDLYPDPVILVVSGFWESVRIRVFRSYPHPGISVLSGSRFSGRFRIRVIYPYPGISVVSISGFTVVYGSRFAVVSGSRYSGLFRIRVIWPYSGISVVSGSGNFGGIRIQVFQPYPGPLPSLIKTTRSKIVIVYKCINSLPLAVIRFLSMQHWPSPIFMLIIQIFFTVMAESSIAVEHILKQFNFFF